jgi:hypothetical protein
MRTGRFSLLPERIKHRDDIDKMLAAVDAAKGGHP